MAKKKKTRRKQGVASWITSVFALFIALTPAITAATASIRMNLPSAFASLMVKWYTGVVLDQNTLEFRGTDPKQLAVGWGTMLGAIAFKKASSALIKSAKIDSVFPRIS